MTTTPDAAYKTVQLSGGRVLSYATYGVQQPDNKTLTVFYFHGFLSSRFEGVLLHDGALARNIRIVAPDRPGTGHSTFQPHRTLTDWPKDVLALADDPSIGAQQFAVWGTSGGAAYALACCHGIPQERLRAGALACGLYPTNLGVSGMEMGLRAILAVAPWTTSVVSWLIDKGMARLARQGREQLQAAIEKNATAWPEADKTAWKGNERGIREVLTSAMIGALLEPQTGAQGAAWDANILGSAWPFGLEDVRMDKGKLVLWHGTLDPSCPFAMAEKATALLDGSELRPAHGEGHMSLVTHHFEEILDTLKQRAA